MLFLEILAPILHLRCIKPPGFYTDLYAVKRIVRYLIETREKGQYFGPRSDFRLKAYAG